MNAAPLVTLEVPRPSVGQRAEHLSVATSASLLARRSLRKSQWVQKQLAANCRMVVRYFVCQEVAPPPSPPSPSPPLPPYLCGVAGRQRHCAGGNTTAPWPQNTDDNASVCQGNGQTRKSNKLSGEGLSRCNTYFWSGSCWEHNISLSGNSTLGHVNNGN